MTLLLSELLPLRTTKALGDYAEDVPLPHVYGDLRSAPFPLIRLSDTRFFVADHPMTVTTVRVDKQEVQDWEQSLQSDTAGHTWTEVEFSAPITSGASVDACGTGKLNRTTGALIENPGDIAEDICAIAGRSDDFSDLRAEASAKALVLAGRLWESKAIKLHIDDVMQSSGAIYTPQMARLYPTEDDPAPVLDLRADEARDIEVSATLDDTADVLRLAYDYSYASEKCQHYIELTASPRRYGGLAKEVAYPWLRTPANAEAIGRPVLQRLAGERYIVAFNCSRRSVRPGQWVQLVGNPEWPLPGDDPTVMILTAEVEPDAGYVRVMGETIIDPLPTVTVTAHSLALPDGVESALDVTVRDGIATFTITDADRRPIKGAKVSLDGALAKTTDAQGKVSFPATAGMHELAIEAPGQLAFTIQVRL